MKFEKLATEFTQSMPVLTEIESAGFEAYFVGGSVRDAILKLPIHDVDIATSAYPAEIKTIFHHTVDTGIEHGTVTVVLNHVNYEVTTFRTESTYQDYRRPDHVTFVRSLSEDLKRRDFTINALAMKTDGTIIDHFGGETDIQVKQIRAVGIADERFNEDALRMMRAVRFQSQLDFKIETDTLTAIYKHHQLLNKIAVERIEVEFVKMMTGQNRNAGLQSFIDTGLSQCCPKLMDHQDELNTIAELPNTQFNQESAVWLLLLYGLSVPKNQARSFLKAWKLSNALIEETLRAQEFLTLVLTDQIDPWALYTAGEKSALAAAFVARLYGNTIEVGTISQRYAELPIHTKHELTVNGGDLMAKFQINPGPQLGKTLSRIEIAVVNGNVKNNQAAIYEFLNN